MIPITAITSVSRFDKYPGIQFAVALVRSGVSRTFKEAFARWGYSADSYIVRMTPELTDLRRGFNRTKLTSPWPIHYARAE